MDEQDKLPKELPDYLLKELLNCLKQSIEEVENLPKEDYDKEMYQYDWSNCWD